MDKSDIKDLSKLCKISISDEEASSLLKDLQSILNYMQLLSEVSTDLVAPCYQVVPFKENVFADDEVGDLLDATEYLKNAPAHVGNLIKTPPVIKF
ncbi:MAG: Asp-tRNA(Asn)/Glu-tRNA(Gln) amidotransferase subunit GatC [Chlamydiales bacterium]|nr:Asp-tRNA(Asn)/Glu-tRNA(Gln) amidotransferase subunit GatC [Chlamydiales bacterium]